MTVETEQSSIVFTGIVDGVALNVPFPVQASSELKVRYGATDILAVEGVHYTTALVPPEYLTATVTPMVGFAATSGGTVSVRREVPYTQPTDIPTLATLATGRLEQMFDRIVFICQQLRDALTYVLKFPTTDQAANIGLLPSAAERASMYLGFDVTGKPIAIPAATGTTIMTAFGTAWVQLMSKAAGRVYLDVYSIAEVDAIGTAKIPKSVLTTIGDLIYASGVATAARLGIGTAGQVLTMTAGLPAWATPPAAATQAEQETGSSTTAFVTPGRQQYHPSAAKAWVNFNGTGTPAIRVGYNVSSITDNGTGDFTINFTTAFSSANYGWATAGGNSTVTANNGWWFGQGETAPTASAFRMSVVLTAVGPTDPLYVSGVFYGDQA